MSYWDHSTWRSFDNDKDLYWRVLGSSVLAKAKYNVRDLCLAQVFTYSITVHVLTG